MENKINTKYIIIVLVVVVAMWLLWKKGLFSKLTETATNSASDTSLATSTGISTDLEYILTHINFNSTERKKIDELAKKLELEYNTSWRQSIQAKANQNGISFAQQLCVDAIWMLYNKNGTWTDERGWKLAAEIKKL